MVTQQVPTGDEVVVDRQLCRGHAVCELLAPDFFVVDDEGLAAVVRQPENDADRAAVDDASDNCPAAAIRRATGRAT
ncbi:MAG: putative 3Fe-4S ferredoxin [Frankiales bacterium]|nr:putative 3Fe-4S ferredoxin [Frankiales bacterium]